MGPYKAQGKDVDWHIHDERSLLALQGPLAPSTLQKLTEEDLSKMYFSDFKFVKIAGVDCFLTRTGYVSMGAADIFLLKDLITSKWKYPVEKARHQSWAFAKAIVPYISLQANTCTLEKLRRVLCKSCVHR